MHVALKQEGGTYETPFKVPGAVSISLEQQGELTPFYADGIKYYVASSNGGYQGDLEMAMITDEFREKVLGEKKDTNGVLMENTNVEAKEFALGLQIDGDTEPTLFWFYNCTTTRPNLEGKTTSDSKEPDTDTVSISCAASEDGTVRAKTTKESYEKAKTKWFTEVYKKDAELS